MIRLHGLREAARRIEAEVQDLIGRAERILEQEVQDLEADIASRFTGNSNDLARYLRIEHDGDRITLYLPYNIGTNRRGRPNVSARKAHNPFWAHFINQPFQDALEARGYTEIDPAPGASIEPSGGSAPGVRISAKLPEDLLRRIAKE